MPKLKVAVAVGGAVDEAIAVASKVDTIAQTSAPRESVSAIDDSSIQLSSAVTTSPDELDSMTNLLVDYFGPIDRYIMVAADS